MITIQEAIKIGKKHNEKYDTLQEFEDAYVFFIDDGQTRESGGDCSIAVKKENGIVLRWNQYFMNNKRVIVRVGEPRKIDQ